MLVFVIVFSPDLATGMLYDDSWTPLTRFLVVAPFRENVCDFFPAIASRVAPGPWHLVNERKGFTFIEPLKPALCDVVLGFLLSEEEAETALFLGIEWWGMLEGVGYATELMR